MYSLHLACSPSTLADTTTRYVGNDVAVLPLADLEDTVGVPVPIAGRVLRTTITAHQVAAGTQGTSEAVAVALMVGAVAIVLDAAVDLTGIPATGGQMTIQDSVSVAVAVGDVLKLRVVSIAMATNPLLLSWFATFLIEDPNDVWLQSLNKGGSVAFRGVV